MYVCRYAYCSPGEYPAWWDGGWRIITSVFPCWCWHLWTSSEFLLPRHLCFLVMDSGAAGEGTTDHPLVHCLALNNPHSWMTPNGYHLSLDTHFTIEHLVSKNSKNKGWSNPCERQNNIYKEDLKHIEVGDDLDTTSHGLHDNNHNAAIYTLQPLLFWWWCTLHIHNLDDPLDVMGWAESAFIVRLICGRCHTGPAQAAVRARAGHKPSRRLNFHNYGEEEKKEEGPFSLLKAPTFKTLC